MTPKIDLVNVKVSVNGKEQVIKMERGTSFENNGGIFTAGENKGVLKMTDYQARTFLAMANNSIDDNETIKYDEILKNKKNEIDLTGAVLSKKDIQEAQQKYRNGGFVADMSEFLPEGYKIERPKLTSAENMVQAYVTNDKESQSATLKFSFKGSANEPNINVNVSFNLDKFHFKQALHHLALNTNIEEMLKLYVLSNSKNDFIKCCDSLVNSFPYRLETIESKKQEIILVFLLKPLIMFSNRLI